MTKAKMVKNKKKHYGLDRQTDTGVIAKPVFCCMGYGLITGQRTERKSDECFDITHNPQTSKKQIPAHDTLPLWF